MPDVDHTIRADANNSGGVNIEVQTMKPPLRQEGKMTHLGISLTFQEAYRLGEQIKDALARSCH